MKRMAVLLALASSVGVAQAGVMDAVAQLYVKQAGLDKLTTVIPPGNRVGIAGKALLVNGSSICPGTPVPDSKGIWVMGMDNELYRTLHEGRGGCVVVGPHTTEVTVVLYDKTGDQFTRRQEQWSVEHKQVRGFDAILLKRPNSEVVADVQ